MACRKMNEDVDYARNTKSGCKWVSMQKLPGKYLNFIDPAEIVKSCELFSFNLL